MENLQYIRKGMGGPCFCWKDWFALSRGHRSGEGGTEKREITEER